MSSLLAFLASRVDILELALKTWLICSRNVPLLEAKVYVGTVDDPVLSCNVCMLFQLYDLEGGSLLVSVVVNSLPTSVALSPLETEVYVGTADGPVLVISMTSPPRQLEYHLDAENTKVLSGHSAAVRSLSASRCGSLLLSGSVDGSVKLWNVVSGHCELDLSHQGPVTNAFFAPKAPQMFHTELKPSVVLSGFQTANSEQTDCISVITERPLALCSDRTLTADTTQTDPSSEARIKSMQMEIDLLRSINSNLYRFSVNKIIRNNKTVSPVARTVEGTGPNKTSKKKNNLKKTSKHGFNSLTKHVVPIVGSSVNGISKKKKKKKRKNKIEITN
ncbi:WD repeat-containing protein 18 [Homalodisca vitripennis]|nr:WD repeat-containing protein 18 [Homalodisca vitripennis]